MMPNFRVKIRAINWLAASATTLLVGGAMSSALLLVTSSLWIPVLYVTVGVSAWFGWRKTRWPDKWSEFFSIGAILFLVCVLQRSLYLLDYVVSGVDFQRWPVFSESPAWAMFKGEIITVSGILGTILAWRLAGGLKISPSVLFERGSIRIGALWIIYWLSLLGIVFAQQAPDMSAFFGQALPTLLGLGLTACFLIPVARFERRINQFAIGVILSCPFVIVALGKGMKENIILALLPSAVLAWRLFRRPIARMAMVAAGVAVVGIATAYVGHYREEVWHSRSELPTAAVVESFLNEADTVGLVAMTADGSKGFLARNNSSLYRGWAVSIADEEGYYPALVFAPLAYVLIPRLMWPDKPEIRQGWEYSGVLFGDSYIASSDSSTSAGLYTSFYLGAGWAGVILGAAGVGLMLALCSRLCARFLGSYAAGLYMFSLVPLLIRLDETWSVGALSGPVVSLAYVSIIWLLAKLVVLVLPSQQSMSRHLSP